MSEFADLRNRMVDVQLARRGIRDRRVLDAMRVLREQFADSFPARIRTSVVFGTRDRRLRCVDISIEEASA